MTSWPKLANAPIVEGLIDIRVERSGALTTTALATAADAFAAEFPSRKLRSRWTARFDFGPGTVNSSAAEEEPDAVVLRSVDDRWVVQLQLDGLTVSRLHPYGQWSELLAKAKEWWGRYRAVVGSQKVTRIATRFINRVPLPAGEPFDHTFATTFTLGPALPQAVAGYLLRAVIPFEADGVTALLTQSLEQGAAECLLDIDVVASHADGIAPEAVWARLEVLRELKNRLFFGSLLKEAVARFQ